MNFRKFRNWILSLACIGFGITNALGSDAAATRWAVILAPGEYAQLPAAPHHKTAGRELRQQLEKAGFPANQIIVLSANAAAPDRKATAANFRKQLESVRDSAGADDVILIAVASMAQTISGADYLCTHETPANGANAAGDAVSISEIVQTLRSSESKHRVLVVDSAMPGKTDGERMLGQQSLALPEGQWAIFSSSHRLRTDAPASAPTTWFMQSLLDGLAAHADGNVDGQVSLLELTEYLQLYADTRQCPAPMVHGKTAQDFPLADVSSDPLDALKLDPKLRESLARSLLDSANVSMFVEKNPRQALQSLQRAAQYRPTEKLTREIDLLTDTALTATGEVAKAWKRASSRSEPLFLHVHGELEVCQTGQIRGTMVPHGIYVKAVSEAATDTEKWLYVTGAYQVKYGDRRVSFTEYPIQPGMIRMSQASQPIARPAVAKELSTDPVRANLKSLLSRTSDARSEE